MLMKYLNSALNMMRVEPDEVMVAYFSKENVDALQKEIISSVKRTQDWSCPDNRTRSSLNIMVFMYENYKMTLGGKPTNTAVKELNAHVLKTTVPMVGNGAASQIKYVYYISKPREPLPVGISTSSRGTDVFEFRPGI